ncbi:MAG: high light inducible protein [Synechococcus sp. MED650]|nr:high light inducible protein [Synechococcus sp. MED650]OUW52779.1 MAG: high light inducible protein [Cyanobacteria bacterium TMED188]
MQVTTEDGGRLNAFAKEPQMEVMDLQTSRSRGRSSLMMMLGGSLLVAALMAVTVAIS